MMAGCENRLVKQRLAESILLLALTPEQLRKIGEIGEPEFYSAGERILTEGTPGDALYLILNGKVCVDGGRRPLAHLSADDTLQSQYEGDFFGEMAILDHEPRSANVTAVTNVLLFRIDRDALYDLFAQDTALQVVLLTNMARTLSRRLRSANRRIER
ncbi:MAG: hypothetical protein D6679_02745 [Candidatus Hydrogenedentota bacterium]|nr:MAG: hypothetical protein D6679_02745 [Candidatus Hydrogenedentota bacterium]